jgi:hypothetical protein
LHPAKQIGNGLVCDLIERESADLAKHMDAKDCFVSFPTPLHVLRIGQIRVASELGEGGNVPQFFPLSLWIAAEGYLR